MTKKVFQPRDPASGHPENETDVLEVSRERDPGAVVSESTDNSKFFDDAARHEVTIKPFIAPKPITPWCPDCHAEYQTGHKAGDRIRQCANCGRDIVLVDGS